MTIPTCDDLFSAGLAGKEALINKLLDLGENKIIIKNLDDASSIGALIGNLSPISLDIETRKNIISKIEIYRKIDPKDKESIHRCFVYPFVNPERQPEMIKFVLSKGFDPGALENGWDVLEIAVQQTQGTNRDEKTSFNKEDFNQNIADYRYADMDLIRLMLRSGKIAGFLGEEGLRKAQIIENILISGELPEEGSEYRDSRERRGQCIRLGENNTHASYLIDGDILEIEKDGDKLYAPAAALAYLHQFHGRTVPSRGSANVVMDQPVAAELFNITFSKNLAEGRIRNNGMDRNGTTEQEPATSFISNWCCPTGDQKVSPENIRR